MTLIIGSEGSMGKRYQAILKYLNEPFECLDKKGGIGKEGRSLEEYDSFIVATPTETHHDIVCRLGQYDKPILCEKPLSKDLKEVLSMINAAPKLSIMMQYRKLISKETGGLSWYDYFRHGNDGLIWDCFQIIALGTEQVNLRETSPVWRCGINGQQLSLANMDDAYIKAVDDWLHGEKISDLEMFKFHKKVKQYEVEFCLKKSL